ncbi:hypothetical protein BHE90_006420 [Fusarium euwallaceae]|uniref:Uncharacterized protein n=1 Tax=Fusarium euwallaceae TaxID=1147111 RepID=A0A430LTS0_9HYPO|nr:hypothetical protein BHE90_006420 [Fusarium euwallaceae]
MEKIPRVAYAIDLKTLEVGLTPDIQEQILELLKILRIDKEDLVHFDLITSSTKGGWWQDLCIKIPVATGRKVAFTGDDPSTTQPLLTPLTGFCQIFESNDGCRISLKLEDGALFRMGADAIIHRASPGEGIALADVLDQYELSVQQKISLAHSVALAFWQYYDSQLVNRAWTSDTIWLMPEPDPDPEDSSERLPLRAYIEFYPEAIECAYDASEFIMTHVLVHRCPRIQYLALLLLQIGLGRPFRGSSFDKEVLRLNTDYSVALKYLNELKSATWNFEHKHIFDDSIEECLKFNGLMGKDEHPDADDRRRQILEKVVSPLGWLNHSFQKTDAQIDNLSPKRHLFTLEPDESDFEITTQEPLPTSHRVEDAVEMEIPEMRPTDRQGFETAIICALSLEADAIEALFDHHWKDDQVFYGKAPGDTNVYSPGVMGRHNVVLVYMSGMGKSAAAAAAASCRISFPKINLAILVGVCGAVPVIHDTGQRINLGDVIISNGVIQYDFGRQKS